jgi:hypothetical protein
MIPPDNYYLTQSRRQCNKLLAIFIISREGKDTMGDKGKKDRDKREKQKVKQQAVVEKKKQQKNVKENLFKQS